MIEAEKRRTPVINKQNYTYTRVNHNNKLPQHSVGRESSTTTAEQDGCKGADGDLSYDQSTATSTTTTDKISCE
jgi:hypothetical protein